MFEEQWFDAARVLHFCFSGAAFLVVYCLTWYILSGSGTRERLAWSLFYSVLAAVLMHLILDFSVGLP